jgi:hypothetical protein
MKFLGLDLDLNQEMTAGQLLQNVLQENGDLQRLFGEST